jgi:hypothetical protein
MYLTLLQENNPMKNFWQEVLSRYTFSSKYILSRPKVWLRLLRLAIKANSISLAAIHLVCREYDTFFQFHILELARASRRRWSAFYFSVNTGPMWWAQLCLLGFTLTTTLEHNLDEDDSIIGKDQRVWKFTFNFFQLIYRETI